MASLWVEPPCGICAFGVTNPAALCCAACARRLQYLERLTGDLEAAAHPALDALTGKVGMYSTLTAVGICH